MVKLLKRNKAKINKQQQQQAAQQQTKQNKTTTTTTGNCNNIARKCSKAD